MIPKCMSWLDAFDEPISDMEDKEDNPSPQSTPQVLPSIELYTSPVTHPEEVEETIGIPIEGFLKQRKKFFFTDPGDGVRINPDGIARFLALGWHLEEIHVTWAHLEKKQTRLRLYTKSLKKLYIQSVETASRVSSDGVRTFEVTASEIW
ncbi:hypothetical protein Tco_0748829 [Tanacetum coccineum]|uniref:Uncharacterized protein n=1 Tax=Tanacetum coccineum TaxID=301880 RepID=A0ABQ4YWS7_9ASTR